MIEYVTMLGEKLFQKEMKLFAQFTIGSLILKQAIMIMELKKRK